MQVALLRVEPEWLGGSSADCNFCSKPERYRGSASPLQALLTGIEAQPYCFNPCTRRDPVGMRRLGGR
jgi:hypothetical protein